MTTTPTNEEIAKKLASLKAQRLMKVSKDIRKARSVLTQKMLQIASLLESTREDLKRLGADGQEDLEKTTATMRAFAHVQSGIPRDEIKTYQQLTTISDDDRAVLTRQGSGFAVLKAIVSDAGLRQDVIDRMRANIAMDVAAVRSIRRQRKLATETPLLSLVRAEPDRNQLPTKKEMLSSIRTIEGKTLDILRKLVDLAGAENISDDAYQVRCGELSPLAGELYSGVRSTINTEDMARDWAELWMSRQPNDKVAEALIALQSIATGDYYIRDEVHDDYWETDDNNVDKRLLQAIGQLVGARADKVLDRLKPTAERRRVSAEARKPKLIIPSKTLRSIEICAGAGGQAIGLHEAGFKARAIFEREEDAVRTLREHFCGEVNRVFAGDINEIDFSIYNKGIDLVAGGVPCQPFSTAGKQEGENDERDLFKRAVEIVDEIQPRAFLFENVQGFGRSSYIAYRSELHAAFEAIGYQSRVFPMWGTDYGLAQGRPRVVFVGFKDAGDMARFRMPPVLPQWQMTLADAIGDLVSANGWKGYEAWRNIANRKGPTIVGGSRKSDKLSFSSGLTRKTWDLLGIDSRSLAKTAPEPNAIGPFRLTQEMGARIQGFPDGWRFQGTPLQIKSQIGNAFPPIMAKAVGLAIHAALEGVEYDYEEALRQPFITPEAAVSRKSTGAVMKDAMFRLAQAERRNREHQFFGEVEYDSEADCEYVVGPGEFKLKTAKETAA
ncbi:DNA (cytosine-5)-methyltransferase 1 [Rhizobium soli]|uniref:Cytosine-specific methyltransferase n=1 Tax=Rhizobium soli TaxID=424798 RepID=A0A7X0MTE3_9HYPH|nr:DNA (cytosine-5-)-methyltransferase [Rhizobium soli]MBB6510947.1 DNA (cytosine-5)-methyltransferase 1 [Rhizobium soli]